MSAVERVDERTLRATERGQLLAVAKRVAGGGDRWAVVFTEAAGGGHVFIDSELMVRAFLAELPGAGLGARRNQPNGQPSSHTGRADGGGR